MATKTITIVLYKQYKSATKATITILVVIYTLM